MAGARASAATELIQGTRQKGYDTVSGPPSQILAQLFAGSGSERVRSRQQLNTNMVKW